MVDDGTFRRIDAGSAHRFISQRDGGRADILDDDSSEGAHVHGANRAKDIHRFDLPPIGTLEKPVLIYCYHGNLSRVFAKASVDFQFREVFSLDGGYDGWLVAQGKQISQSKAAASASTPGAALAPPSPRPWPHRRRYLNHQPDGFDIGLDGAVEGANLM
jgi:rhodanese-related sulfurtransferase